MLPTESEQAKPGARSAEGPSPERTGGMEPVDTGSNTSLMVAAAVWVRRFYGSHQRGYTVRLRRDLWEQLGHELMMQDRFVRMPENLYAVRIRNVAFLPRDVGR